MKKILFPIFICAVLLSSCEDFLNTDGTDNGLSDEDIINGLKTALSLGADSASTNLSVVNAYYNNPLIKIPLPPEAVAVRNKINGNTTLSSISSLIGLEGKFEDVILSVNRSAEDAAEEAAPIFKNAITGLTISQGWDILTGIVPSGSTKSLKTTGGAFDSIAATKYLIVQTYDPLTDLYAPKMNESLGKVLVGGVSATQAWNTLTSTYNTFLARTDVKTAISIAKLLGQDPNLPSSINSDLGEFSTQKALDGLFLKVGDEEKKIRKDPYQWAIDIIQKVFGYVQESANS